MATSLPWHPLFSSKPQALRPFAAPVRHRLPMPVRAFRRSDFDGFAKRMASGDAWRDAWRSANDGFELLIFEAKKTAERIDRQYAVSRRFSEAVGSAGDWAREVDREFEIGRRWRTVSLDFRRNWPRAKAQQFGIRASFGTTSGIKVVVLFRDLDVALEEKLDDIDDKEWARINYENIKDGNEAFLLLNSLLDMYEHLTATLLHGRLAKDECAFCHGKGHWKKDCPKLQKRNKDKIVSNACVAKFGDNGSDFALVGLSLACNSEEWILDIESTYHMCPYKEWFSCFEEQ
ncbi:hypothetical protein CK203_111324 [Vitis vinifera]|uniref:CCHC-type domain-containing protein n=1 Tax=Vitis vinifera TaxID=29760 RepID=A0A438CAD6_VITVI|nr:hypothetical protein CK203_111324 [Vitis vinifera]